MADAARESGERPTRQGICRVLPSVRVGAAQGARQDADPTGMNVEVQEGNTSRIVSPDRSRAHRASPADTPRVRTRSASASSGGRTRSASASSGGRTRRLSDVHESAGKSSNLVCSSGKRTRLHTEHAGRASRRCSAQAMNVPNAGAGEVLVSAPGDLQPIVSANATGASGGGMDNVPRTPSKRGRSAPCGRRNHGDTSSWPDPCDRCAGSVSHAGESLCCACHRPCTHKNGDGEWRHLQVGDLEGAASFLASVKNETSSGLRVHDQYKPHSRLLVFQRRLLLRSIPYERSWRSCSARKADVQRLRGRAYHAMEKGRYHLRRHAIILRACCGAQHTRAFLPQSGKLLDASSDVCNGCWLFMRNKKK